METDNINKQGFKLGPPKLGMSFPKKNGSKTKVFVNNERTLIDALAFYNEELLNHKGYQELLEIEHDIIARATPNLIFNTELNKLIHKMNQSTAELLVNIQSYKKNIENSIAEKFGIKRQYEGLIK